MYELISFNFLYYKLLLFKVVPDSPAYVQKVTIFWHVKK